MTDHNREKIDLLEVTGLMNGDTETDIPDGRTVEFRNDQHSRENELITENGITNGDRNIDTELTSTQSYDSPTTKCGIYKTGSLYLLFFAQGLCTSLIGLTIVHLERIFESSTQFMAFSFTSQAIGFVSGGILCGVIFDRINKELCFSVIVTLVFVAMCMAAFVGNVYAFMVCLFLQALPFGFLTAAGQSYCVNLWLKSRFKEPLLQGAHAIWSLGAAIGPLIIKSFLIELNENVVDTMMTTTSYYNNTTRLLQLIDNSSASQEIINGSLESTNTSYSDPMLHDVAKARYAYLSMGVIFLVCGLPFIALFLYDNIRNCRKNKRTVNTDTKEKLATKPSTDESKVASSRCLSTVFLLMLFVFAYLYLYIEGVYFFSFCIKQLHWSVHNASILVSVFFWAHFSGRIASIPLSAFLRPRTMLMANLIVTSSAYLLLLLVNIVPFILWISAATAGFTMASTFPTMVLWVSEAIAVTGRVSSVMVVGASVSHMTGPMFVGMLFGSYSPMWMIYILAIVSVLHILFFISQLIFVFKFKRRLQNGQQTIVIDKRVRK